MCRLFFLYLRACLSMSQSQLDLLLLYLIKGLERQLQIMKHKETNLFLCTKPMFTFFETLISHDFSIYIIRLSIFILLNYLLISNFIFLSKSVPALFLTSPFCRRNSLFIRNVVYLFACYRSHTGIPYVTSHIFVDSYAMVYFQSMFSILYFGFL